MRKHDAQLPKKLVVVLKGYPRLSETFIAQELLGLERAGIELVIVSLRQPTDSSRHAVHDEIQAPILYLPEYLHESPLRVTKSFFKCLSKYSFTVAFKEFLSDFVRDFSRSRIRRFGQAIVLSAEWPQEGTCLYAHFIHTPASVTSYASRLLGVPWSVSAHAKDIWTSPDWDLANKLSSARWAVTCTRVGHKHLQSLASDASRVHLSYHGLDLDRFPRFERDYPVLDGRQQDKPVTILSVGRAVPKKGFDVLLRALSELPSTLHWRLVHIGGGGELDSLKSLAATLNIENKISWMGAINQSAVLAHYRSADVFALACKITSDGDRDGLPNVLVEAASQGLACISTNISGIPELFVHNQNGLLVEPEDPQAMAEALRQAISMPQLRYRLGVAAQDQVRSSFDYHVSIEQLVDLFDQQWALTS